MQSRQALQLAKDEGLDLVLVSAAANPPVAKIIDYGKHKYLEGKQGKDKKSKQLEVKGIKISPRIAEHDLAFQTKKAIGFIEDGHKVKITCMFKAREITHPELGRKKLDLFAEMCVDHATVERTPTLDGRLMIMVLNPKPGVAAKKKDAKDKDAKDPSKQAHVKPPSESKKREAPASEAAPEQPVAAAQEPAEAATAEPKEQTEQAIAKPAPEPKKREAKKALAPADQPVAAQEPAEAATPEATADLAAEKV